MGVSHHRFYLGDVREVLKQLPSESVHCCVTSPPYWGLRDYGVPGQLGLEPAPEEYVANMVEVFREVRRALRKDGTLWLNLGDTYSQDTKWGGKSDHKNYTSVAGGYQTCRNLRTNSGLKPKDLVGIPWRVAFALQADGWWLRSDIVWSKPNAMPESVENRPTKAHEYVFLLAKSEKYFYDADAIREQFTNKEVGWLKTGAGKTCYGVDGVAIPGDIKKPTSTLGGRPNPTGRNKRSVWTIPTEPYPGAHFAVFPQALVEPCILAGTSPKACPVCGSPWKRVVKKETIFEGGSGKAGRTAEEINSRDKWEGKQYGKNIKLGPVTSTTTMGWQPTCSCPDNDGSGRCVVLDPFGGSGTVSMVAARFERNSIYIDLNEQYLDLALERCGFGRDRLFDCHTFEVFGNQPRLKPEKWRERG